MGSLHVISASFRKKYYVNILLVEDDYLLGRSTARLIEKAGQHKVRLTRKVSDIFKHCQSGQIDLVVMDVNLPGTIWQGKEVTGIELSRLLKQQSKTARLPIVLLTANFADVSCAQLVSEALADGIYTKPIADANEFLTLLDQIKQNQEGASDDGFQEITASAS